MASYCEVCTGGYPGDAHESPHRSLTPGGTRHQPRSLSSSPFSFRYVCPCRCTSSPPAPTAPNSRGSGSRHASPVDTHRGDDMTKRGLNGGRRGKTPSPLPLLRTRTLRDRYDESPSSVSRPRSAQPQSRQRVPSAASNNSTSRCHSAQAVPRRRQDFPRASTPSCATPTGKQERRRREDQRPVGTTTESALRGVLDRLHSVVHAEEKQQQHNLERVSSRREEDIATTAPLPSPPLRRLLADHMYASDRYRDVGGSAGAERHDGGRMDPFDSINRENVERAAQGRRRGDTRGRREGRSLPRSPGSAEKRLARYPHVGKYLGEVIYSGSSTDESGSCDDNCDRDRRGRNGSETVGERGTRRGASHERTVPRGGGDSSHQRRHCSSNSSDDDDVLSLRRHDGPRHNSALSLMTPTANTTTTAPPTEGDRSVWYRQLRLQQEAFQRSQHTHMEELRQGFVELCAAVREDLHRMQRQLDKSTSATAKANSYAAAGQSAVGVPPRSRPPTVGLMEHGRKSFPNRGSAGDTTTNSGINTTGMTSSSTGYCCCCGRSSTSTTLLPGGVSDRSDMVKAAPSASELAMALSHATEEERRELAKVLLPSLSPTIEAYVHANCDRIAKAARQPPSFFSSPPPLLPVDFSSPEALDAHLRTVARAVLAEEDAQRYSTASAAEQRHTRALQEAQRQWRAETERLLVSERKSWLRSHGGTGGDLTRVYAQLEALQSTVQALTDDVSELTHRHLDQQSQVSRWLQAEREVQAQHASEVEGRIVERVREHLQETQKAQRAETERQQSTRMGDKGGRDRISFTPNQTDGGAATSAATTPTNFANADAIRLEVIFPALEHMKRLLAAHQKVVDATVEERCSRATQQALDARHVWDQNVTELRTKLQSLRSDVRGAFAELCMNLNVASPGL